MLDSVKNKTQRTGLISLLTFIVTGTQGPHGFAFVPKAEADKLAKAEPTFLTIDTTVTNAEGLVKTVATQVAIDALSAGASAATAAATGEGTSEKAEASTSSIYEIVTLEAIPDIMRGGQKGDSYPFAKLNAYPAPGNAFFVPATEKKPNPAKGLASTIASANKKYSPKKFTVRKAVDKADATKVLGAHVIRTV